MKAKRTTFGKVVSKVWPQATAHSYGRYIVGKPTSKKLPSFENVDKSDIGFAGFVSNRDITNGFYEVQPFNNQ